MLSQEFDTLSSNDVFSKIISPEVLENLNPAFPFREYQVEAISRLSHYLNGYKWRVRPTHLLFHLATGSGKTLVMAASILHLYKLGYRNFLFFVNSANVLEKTKDNFLNSLSPKYQFAPRITIDNNEVKIVSVDNFESANSDSINILFSTIQGLHTRLNQPGENQITFEDFINQKIVLLSDEAHHINALTKSNLPAEEVTDLRTWETTINKIFRSSPHNILLEFTATIGMDHPSIKSKYDNKILLEYTLKQFRQDGYSKEVQVLQTDLEPIERTLQAVIVSQFRRKVAGAHRIALKPVLLLKSRTIEDSKEFEATFHSTIRNLKVEDLSKLNSHTAPEIVKKAFQYLETKNISLDNLVSEIKEEFGEDRCISVNSKNDSIEKQITVNNLESNELRVVFTVNMLNEGWDVLNLYDIVRLYNTRDARGGNPGPTTIAEAQLIGRGARYFPFLNGDGSDRFKRKFDRDISNEMRVLEELYYHSENNPRYIQELHKALVTSGIVADEAKEVHVAVKEGIKTSDFWKNGVIFLNKRVKNDFGGIFGFSNANIPTRYKVVLRTGFSETTTALDEESNQRATNAVVSKSYHVTGFQPHVIRKAITKNPFFEFQNLKTYFPHLTSISEFISSSQYLGEIVAEVQGRRERVDALTRDDELYIALEVLRGIEAHLKSDTAEFVGTKMFYATAVSLKIKDKTLRIAVSDSGDQEYGIGMSQAKHFELRLDLKNEDWFIYDENYGTYEEKALIKFVYSQLEHLKTSYQQIYLLRNEKLFQIYRFSDGAAVEPDFVLFLKKKEDDRIIGYQLFIEPKGQHLLLEDQWKEDFLKEIQSEFKVDLLLQNTEYLLFGLPFFNEGDEIQKQEFEQTFSDITTGGTHDIRIPVNL